MLEVFGTFRGSARASFHMIDPGTGELKTVKRIDFEDGTAYGDAEEPKPAKRGDGAAISAIVSPEQMNAHLTANGFSAAYEMPYASLTHAVPASFDGNPGSLRLTVEQVDALLNPLFPKDAAADEGETD